MPPDAVQCAACASDKSLLSVSSHWTGCSCHRRFFTLLARPERLNSPDLVRKTDTIFSLLHRLSHPPLPSPCPLLGLQFLSRVCLTLPTRRSCQHTLSLFDSCFYSPSVFLLVLGGVTVVECVAPWQHRPLRTRIRLSCTFSCCFYPSLSFFSVPPGECETGVCAREADGSKKVKESKS